MNFYVFIDQRVNKYFEIVGGFIARKQWSGIRFRNSNITSDKWISDMNYNEKKLDTIITKNDISKMEMDTLKSFKVFFKKVQPTLLRDVSHQENLATLSHRPCTMAENILEKQETFDGQEWTSILNNTNDIFNTITEINKLMFIQEDPFEKANSNTFPLVCNDEWNHVLFRNNMKMNGLFNIGASLPKTRSKTKTSIEITFSETLEFIEKLRLFTEYTLECDENYATLSEQCLNNLKEKLQTMQKNPANQRWSDIVYTTQEIFDLLTEIGDDRRVWGRVIFTPFTQNTNNHSLQDNRVWSDVLFKNNKVLDDFLSNYTDHTHANNILKNQIQTLRASLSSLYSDTLSKKILRIDYATLQEGNLSSLKIAFQNYKAAYEANPAEDRRRGDGMAHSPWPAIERLAAIVARL